MAVTTATWTPPITWTADTPISVARCNNFFGTGPSALGGNENYLYDWVTMASTGRYAAMIKRNNGSGLSFTSTTYVNVDGTNVTLTGTINTGRAIVFFQAFNSMATTLADLGLDFTVDGTRWGLGGGFSVHRNSDLGNKISIGYTALVTGLSVASHTFTPQIKIGAGTATLEGNNTYPITFGVIEI